MQPVARGRIVDAVDAVLEADARGEPLEPPALALLLRQYVATGRDDIAAALGRGLERALDAIDAAGPTFRSGAAPELPPSRSARFGEPGKLGPTSSHHTPADPAAWLTLFAEAAPLTEDDQLRAAAATLAGRLRGEWPCRGAVAPAMRSVAACLSASPILDDPQRDNVIPAAIDELERIVGRVYRPGEAIAHSLDCPDEEDGDLRDHVDAAGALLTAHAVTGRLPYSMLAEELVQFALGRFASDDFLVRCDMARVLCRLAALHEDDEYRRTAVVAVRSDYASEAERILATVYSEHGARNAVYGLALDEWLRATRQMQ